MWLYKDCTTSCPHGACNKEMDSTLELYRSDREQESCYACTYLEQENGDVIGNSNCLDNADKFESVACPIYANAGCYTGSNTHKVSTMLGSAQRYCIFRV